MGAILFNSDGKPISISGSVASPEQYTISAGGEVINPAREDGHLLEIANFLTSAIYNELVNKSNESTLSALNSKFQIGNYGIKVDGSSVVQPITATLLPLPMGAATESTLQDIKNKLNGTLAVDGSAIIQPVNVLSSILPADAAKNSTLLNGTQKTQIVDSSGNVISSTNNAVDVNIKSGNIDIVLNNSEDNVLVYGNDGTANKAIKVDDSGYLETKIILSTLPIGAATEATLSSLNSKIPNDLALEDGNLLSIKSNTDKLDTPLSTIAKQTTLASIDSKLSSSSYGLKVDGSAVTQPISAVSLPLPAGASTSTNQQIIIQNLTDLKNEVATEYTLSDLNNKIINTPNGIKVVTDQLPPVTVSSLPLPQDAAKDSTLTSGSQKTKIVDGNGNVIGVTNNALDVNIKSGITLDTNITHLNDSVSIYGSDGSVDRVIKTDSNGNVNVIVSNSVLPTGAATSSSQDTTNNYLSQINDKVATESTLLAINNKINTYYGKILVDTTNSHIYIDNTTLPLPTSASTSEKQDEQTAVLNAINNKINTASGKIIVDGSGVVQPVSGTVSATQNGVWDIRNITGTITLPIGAATSSNQDVSNNYLNQINNKVATDATLSNVVTNTNNVITQLDTRVRALYDSNGNPVSTSTFSGYNALFSINVPEIKFFTYLGKEFVAYIDNVAINTTWYNYFLLRNPSGSGKIIVIDRIICAIPAAVTGRSLDARIVATTSITNNGTTLTIRNTKIGSATASVSLASYSPVYSSNIINGYSIPQNGGNLIIDVSMIQVMPGYSVGIDLISNGALTPMFTIYWHEI